MSVYWMHRGDAQRGPDASAWAKIGWRGLVPPISGLSPAIRALTEPTNRWSRT